MLDQIFWELKSVVCCLQDWMGLHELYRSINGITIVHNTLIFALQQCNHGIKILHQTPVRVYMCSCSCYAVWSSSETTLSLQECKFFIPFVSVGYRNHFINDVMITNNMHTFHINVLISFLVSSTCFKHHVFIIRKTIFTCSFLWYFFMLKLQ